MLTGLKNKKKIRSTQSFNEDIIRLQPLTKVAGFTFLCSTLWPLLSAIGKECIVLIYLLQVAVEVPESEVSQVCRTRYGQGDDFFWLPTSTLNRKDFVFLIEATSQCDGIRKL